VAAGQARREGDDVIWHDRTRLEEQDWLPFYAEREA
jgi:hypothetical protein